MTRVSLSKEGDRYSVMCEGHAVGSTTVCAAVSTLVYTLLGWLKNADCVTVEREEIADGYAEIKFSGGASADTVFGFVYIGFLQLQASYGNFIEVNF